MSVAQCTCSSRRALIRVLPQLESHKFACTRRFFSGQSRIVPQQGPRSLHVVRNSSQIRHATWAPRRSDMAPRNLGANDNTKNKEKGYDKRFTTREDFEKSGRDRLPQDHEITDPWIMVIENGSLTGPMTPREVLRTLDPVVESLRMVTPYIAARPKDEVVQQYAICKIVNKRDEYARQRQLKERKKQSKASTTKIKEIEINWGISENDLNTKLRQMAGFLGKGMRVELEMGIKKRSKNKVDEEAAVAMVKKVKKSAEELGAREWKPVEGEVGKTLRLYLEGAKPKKEKTKPVEVEAEAEAETEAEAEEPVEGETTTLDGDLETPRET